MKYSQIADVLTGTITSLNPVGVDITGEETGTKTILEENLSNIVDVGKTVVLNMQLNDNYFNNFMTGLIDRVGKVTNVNRTYTGSAPNLIKDSWEFASILMKNRISVPEAIETTSWKLGALGANTDANGYNGIGQNPELDPFILAIPDVTTKIYNKADTFTIPLTTTEMQLKTAFTSAEQMASFIAMIENRIRTMQTAYTNAVIRRALNNMAVQTAKQSRVVNLLSLYNTAYSQSLTAETALASPDFVRFMSLTISAYKDYLKDLSSKYNDGTYLTFTPSNRVKMVMLNNADKALKSYLYSSTYHDDYVKMDGYEVVNYWQGQGLGTSQDNLLYRSTISAIPASETATPTIYTLNYVICMLFDEESCVICNERNRVTSQYNARGEYWNYFYMWDCRYLNDTAENFLVFTLADPVSRTPE